MFEYVKNVDWARMAAFIDGEGCIAITRLSFGVKNPRYQLVLQITNTDPRLLIWLGKTFEGQGSFSVRPIEGQRPRHDWCIASKKAEAILQGCLPYFVMKRDQAELAIAFQKTKRYWGKSGIVPTDIRSSWELMYQEMQALKVPPVRMEQIQ